MSARFLPFLAFLAQEEHALLRSIAAHPLELYLFTEVNELYQPAIQHAAGSTDPRLGLLGFCHVNYYFAFAGLCRGHFASAFHSLRVAIDATLVAYRMLVEQKTDDFAFQRSNYMHAKNHVANRRKQASAHQQPDPFPKAPHLIGLHEFCSEHASHADPSAWGNRLLTSGSVAMVYFGLRSSERRFSVCAAICIAAHATILAIFSDLLRERNIWDSAHDERLRGFMSELAERGTKLTADGDPLLEKLLSSFPLTGPIAQSSVPAP